MRGHDQLEIQSQRAAETAWSSLAFDTNSPYVDGRAPLVAGLPLDKLSLSRASRSSGATGRASWTTMCPSAIGATRSR
jgi:hypothetical protein